VVSSENEPTEDPALARVTITVAFEESERVLVALSGYIQIPEEA
jgi:hypothetical protein